METKKGKEKKGRRNKKQTIREKNNPGGGLKVERERRKSTKEGL